MEGDDGAVGFFGEAAGDEAEDSGMPIGALFDDDAWELGEVEESNDFEFGFVRKFAAFFVGLFEVVGGGGDFFGGDFVE